MRTTDQTKQLFDKWAATYDQGVLTPGGILEGYTLSMALAAELVPVAPGARVLDIGTGTGAFGALLAGRGARVAGVDVSAGMLAKCAEVHPDFELKEGGFLPISFGDGEFDAAVASFAFHEVLPADRPAACAELARVVRPGGHICLLDAIFPSAAARDEARRANGPFWDTTESYPLVWELDGLLREAGFEAIHWRQTGPYHWAVAGRRVGAAATPAMVETERLWLTPAPLRLVEAVSAGRREGLRFPARVPAAWPDADLRDFLPIYAGMLAEEPESARWGVWVMIDKESDTLIGDIGFKGSPDEGGRVEIGYSVLPDWRRQGYATEAARALVRWALAQPGVSAVQAECLSGNAGSVRVLEAAGLQRIGIDGELVKWLITQ